MLDLKNSYLFEENFLPPICCLAGIYSSDWAGTGVLNVGEVGGERVIETLGAVAAWLIPNGGFLALTIGPCSTLGVGFGLLG